jgi:hypothetical protein
MGKPFAVVFEDGMDWSLLRDQKLTLLTLGCGATVPQHALLDGVINLIDHIQDSASSQGLPVVWLGEEDKDVYD